MTEGEPSLASHLSPEEIARSRELRAEFHALLKSVAFGVDKGKTDSDSLSALRATYNALRKLGVPITELISISHMYGVTEKQLRTLLKLNRE